MTLQWGVLGLVVDLMAGGGIGIRPSAETPLFAEGLDFGAKNWLLDPDLGTTAVPIPAGECLIRRVLGEIPLSAPGAYERPGRVQAA